MERQRERESEWDQDRKQGGGVGVTLEIPKEAKVADRSVSALRRVHENWICAGNFGAVLYSRPPPNFFGPFCNVSLAKLKN